MADEVDDEVLSWSPDFPHFVKTLTKEFLDLHVKVVCAAFVVKEIQEVSIWKAKLLLTEEVVLDCPSRIGKCIGVNELRSRWPLTGTEQYHKRGLRGGIFGHHRLALLMSWSLIQ